ncbi:MAG: adenylate/guanylate cyclase domain-containing protein, partial [Pseudomonadota bacterium]
TDYVAAALKFASGKRHGTSWSTKTSGGFTTDQLITINELLPAMAMAFEIRLNRRIAKNLLNTYVGQRAGEAILNGNITRGSGDTVRAAIWNCDIRGFTQISEKWPRDDVISWLNDYFDAMAEPIANNKGEILKFIGDGLLAIFPIDDGNESCACELAFKAAIEAVANMRELNAKRLEHDRSELGYGIAMHLGDVMYGNIGSRTRLDFTVIGPAVNASARLERLTKELRRRVLFSGPFVEACPCGVDQMVRLGSYELRGVAGAMDVYGLKDEG